MRILIATGIYPPDVGGPAKYARNLSEALIKAGHTVKVLPYHLEKKLPWGLRHLFYLCRVLFAARSVENIIALDTVSVGFPAVIASFLLGKKIAVRTGGDFLWETYLERSGLKMPLPDFYKIMPPLLFKERVVAKVHQFLLDYTDFIVFSTAWQRDIWFDFYNINPQKIRIIENCYYQKRQGLVPKEKIFLAAGRKANAKNLDSVEKAFEAAEKYVADIKLDMGSYSPEEYQSKLSECYAVAAASLSEVSPNAVIEAISFNKPFILTKYHGIGDRIGEAGIIVDPNRLEDIERAFAKLAEKKVYEDQLAKLAKINFTHSYDEIAKEFIGIFENK